MVRISAAHYAAPVVCVSGGDGGWGVSDIMPRTYDVAAMEIAHELSRLAPDMLTAAQVAATVDLVARRYRMTREHHILWLGLGAMREAVELWEQASRRPLPDEPGDHITATGL